MTEAGTPPLRVLILEDRSEDAELILRELRKLKAPHKPHWVSTPALYEEALGEMVPDLILSDHNIPAYSGRAALELARQRHPGVPFILVTSSLSEEAAVDYMKAGATDYVIKDRILRLAPAAEAAIDRTRSFQESEERYRSLFMNVPVGIFRVDAGGKVLDCNPAMAHLMGYDTPEALARTNTATWYVDAADRDHWRSRLANEGSVSGVEVRLRCRDGREIWVLGTSRIVYSPSGQLRFYEGTMENITERKRAELELREREALFSSLVHASPIAIFQTDAHGMATYVSPKWVDISGLPFRDSMGTGWLTVVHPGDQERVTELLRSSVTAGRPYRMDFRLMRTNGDVRFLHVNAAPILTSDHRIRGFVGTVEDVTERRNLEEQFRQAQKMEGVGQLAGGIAHDFNNLLTAILGYSELILDDVGTSAKPHVQEIIGLTHRAASLTRQLLAFSRQQVLEPRVLDLNRVVSEVYRILARLIREDVEIVTTFAPDLGAVLADPGQLEQVIVNLAVNARDAMPEGGRITIETANVELDADYVATHPMAQAGPHVMLAVTDTGTGMTEEIRRRIFEPFFTTKEVGKGTGLGLATVYGVLKQSNGSVLVYSEPGQGTTFKLYLPRVPTAEETQRPRMPAPPLVTGGKETILLVEDEDAVRKIAEEVLRRYGYTVFTASNGEEALEVFARRGDIIDLLVTDVIMPKMAGRPLVQRVQQLYPRCRILFMSGYAADAVVRHGVLEPGTAFLLKPFTSTLLASKVREVLDGTEVVG